MSTSRARQPRRNSTDAEMALWRILRSSRLAGVKFRRQQPIGPYIADFVCLSHRLIIECDGGQHAESAADAVRDKWFAEQGFRTVRFWNNEVLGNREGVVLSILNGIGAPSPASLASLAQPLHLPMPCIGSASPTGSEPAEAGPSLSRAGFAGDLIDSRGTREGRGRIVVITRRCAVPAGGR